MVLESIGLCFLHSPDVLGIPGQGDGPDIVHAFVAVFHAVFDQVLDQIRGHGKRIKKVNDVIVEPDRELAIKEAYKLANANDVVLVAGKGHEDYQILATETIHFDDREKVKEIFIGE